MFSDRIPSVRAELGSRIPTLDGIRGIAILLVMLHHFGYDGGMRPMVFVDKLFFAVTQLGWCGVDLFFVLSGFLITRILLDTKDGNNFFRNFYIRRILRIFPLYYGFLAAFFLVLPRFAPFNSELQRVANDQSSYWLYLVNLKIALEGWPPFYAIGHFWSLAVEEQFYLFWPFVVYSLRRRELMLLCLIFVAGSFLFRVGLWFSGMPLAAYVLTPARMDPLAIGAYLALVARDPNRLARLLRWAWPVAVSSSVTLLTIIIWRKAFYPHDVMILTVGHTLVAVLFGAAVILAVNSTPREIIHRSLAHPALTFLGRYSYGIYIFHRPIAFLIRQKLFQAGVIATFMESQLPGQMLFMIVAGGFSVGLAWLSWHFYESKFLSLKRLFPYPPKIKTMQAAVV